MSSIPDMSGWDHLGTSDNAEFYLVEPQILAVVPNENSVDDETTARQSVEFQHEYWRGRNERGGSVIFMDRVRDSRAGARRIYGTLPDPALITGFALVGGTVFGRAVASVFIGLSRPSAPTKMVGDFASGVAWLRSLNRSELRG